MPTYKVRDALKEHYRKGAIAKELDWAPREDEQSWFAPNPLPPPPSRFQPDVPVVTSDPYFAREARRLLDIDPKVKQNVKGITVGPTKASIGKDFEKGTPPGSYTNLAGVYDPNDKQVGLAPRRSRDFRFGILAHELGHASGYGEPGAEKSTFIYNDPYGPSPAVKETVTRVKLRRR